MENSKSTPGWVKECHVAQKRIGKGEVELYLPFKPLIMRGRARQGSNLRPAD